MKIIFCNIAYMNQYIGNIEKDIPQGGGKWVDEHKDAHEKWNFLNFNGYCYGFVMQQSNQFHIERVENTSKNSISTEGVTVVWCALNPSGETVIVGWYENATVYRYYQSSMATPFGLERDYFTKAKSEDCYLLPESKRTYVIGRASVQGTGRGFGQSNLWYADSEYAKENIIPNIIEYLQEHRDERMNNVPKMYNAPQNIDVPLTCEEDELASQYYDQNEYMNFLPLGYGAYRTTPTSDNAFFLATAMRELYQFDSAIEWYRKVIDIEGESWDTCSCLPYLFMECERFEDVTSISTHLLTFPEANKTEVKCELYSILADANYNSGNIEKAVSWLDIILSESNDSELIEHTKKVKEDWLTQ